jgi:2-polyprenyl-6-methoxyphenol hydroxylase-like FAD-dependent oxidoreductase
MVLWRGLISEPGVRAGALGGCDLLRPVYQGGHGVAYYVPGPGQGTEPGERLLMWGYYLQVPENALASVLVDDQERQQSGSVPFGKVHPEVRAALESRLAGLLPAPLFDLVQQSGNSSIQAIYSLVPRSYARDRLCLVGDAGTLVPPFAGSGVLRAVTSAASLADALAGAPAVDDALRRWSDAQLQAAAQVIPNAEGIERSFVFGMPDLSVMPAAAANDWVSAAYDGLAVTVTLPGG